MTIRLFNNSEPRRPEKNVWVPFVETAVLKRTAPILNVDPKKLRASFEKLKRELPEGKLLETLLIHAGGEILPLLPELAEFPEPEVVLETFLADERATEEPWTLDEDLVEEDEDVEEMILAVESTRFLKTVMYFWYLAKVTGREAAKDTLVETLHALALHQLLVSGGLTSLQVKFHSKTLSFGAHFRRLLQDTEAEACRRDMESTRNLVGNRVAFEMEDADERMVHRAVGNAQSAIDEVLKKGREETITMRGFSHMLLEDEVAETLAEKILCACPPAKK